MKTPSFLIAVAPFVFLLIASSPAMANFTGVHRGTSGGKDKVVIPNQAPDTTIALTVATTTIRPVTFNDCGWGKLTDSASAPVTAIDTGGSLTFNFAGRTTATTPPSFTQCFLNTQPQGAVVKVGNVLYLNSGITNLGTINLSVTSEKSINAKVNSCGFASVSITPTRPLTRFSVGGVVYNLVSLPTTVNGLLYCRKTGGVAIAYRPLGGF